MTSKRSDEELLRLELRAAEAILRSVPEAVDLAWLHLDRAADRGTLKVEGMQSHPGADRERDVRGAWRKLGELDRRVTASELRLQDRSWRWRASIVVLVVGLLAVLAAVTLRSRDIPTFRVIGWNGAALEDAVGRGFVEVPSGERLVIGLGGMWHVPTVRLTVDHDLPVDVAFMQRGRVCWNTRLVGGEGRVERDYAVRVPERVQRRGFDQLMVTPVEPSGPVRLSGLRLDDS